MPAEAKGHWRSAARSSTYPSALPPSGRQWRRRSIPRKAGCCASIVRFRRRGHSRSPRRIWNTAAFSAEASQRSRRNGRCWRLLPTSSCFIIESKTIAWNGSCDSKGISCRFVRLFPHFNMTLDRYFAAGLFVFTLTVAAFHFGAGSFMPSCKAVSK